MAVAVALAYQIFERALESAGVHLEQAPHALRAFVSSHQAVSYGLLGAAGVLLAINCYYIVATGVPPLLTKGKARQAMLEEVKGASDLGFKGAIYDLGAGWGSLAVPLAKSHPKQRVVAVELSLLCCIVLRARKVLGRLHNLHVVRKDFNDVPVADAAAVVLYLTDTACKVINLKLERELPKGVLVVSNSFSLPEWQPTRVTYAESGGVWPHVYVYHAPGCRAHWVLTEEMKRRGQMIKDARRARTIKAVAWPLVTAVTFALAIYVKMSKVQYS